MLLAVDKLEASSGQRIRGYVSFEVGVGSIVRIPVVLISGTGEGPVVGITGGVHGAEFSSIEAAIRLSREIDPSDLNGGIIIFPIVNVPAFEGIQERYNPLEWPGLFASTSMLPGDPNGTHTARIVNMVYTSFRKQVNYVFDLHGGEPSEWISHHYVMFLQVGEKQVDEAALTMARSFPNARLALMDPKSDYSGYAYTKFGIPYVIAEAGSAGYIQEHAVNFHKTGVLNFLRHTRMIKGDSQLAPKPERLPSYMAGDIHYVNSPVAGIYYSAVLPGDKVEKGQLIATIKDAFGEVIQELNSPFKAEVSYTRTYPPVRQGYTLMQLLSLEGTLRGLE